MALDEDFYVIAYSFPYSRHNLYRLRFLLLTDLAIGEPEGIEFQGLIAFFDDESRLTGEVLRRARADVPPIGISLHAVATQSPQQAINRLANRLADDVPARHLNCADRRHDNRASAPVLVAIHPLPEIFDVEWIAADDMPSLQLVNCCFDGLLLTFQCGLAHARQPFIRFYADKDPVPPGRADNECFNLTDSHFSSEPHLSMRSR